VTHEKSEIGDASLEETSTMKSRSGHKKQPSCSTKKAHQCKKSLGRTFQVATVVVTILRIILEILHFGHSIGLW